MQSVNAKPLFAVSPRAVQLLIAAGLLTVAISPALALKYAAPEHDIDADPTIPTWVPARLDLEPGQEFHIVGSDTMDEITLEWVTHFRKAYPRLSVTMEARASGSGYRGLIDGVSDVATVAREMLPHEVQAFVDHFGYEPTAFRVATGSVGSLGKTAATVVLVDADNPIEGLTLAQLDAIYSVSRKRGHRKIETWGDLGLKGEWQRRPIHLYGLAPPNGIEAYFQQSVLEGGQYKKDIEFVHGEGFTHAFTVAAHDMARQPGGLTYAMLANLTPDVRVVPLAASEDGPYVLPTVETVYEHRYPLSRYIYAYVSRPPGQSLPPRTREFLRLVLSYQGQSAMTQEGVFMPLLPEVVREERARLESM